MSRRALILAAHGSRSDEGVNEDVRRCARRVADLTSLDEVVAAFHAGEPGYADALDRVESDCVTVVPLLTSAGYYCDVVLPRELARAASYRGKSVRVTRPVGEHPGLVSLAATLVEQRMRFDLLTPGDTSLVLVGHGTPRHARSRQATVDVAAALRLRLPCREVLTAFLDEDPGVATIPLCASGKNVLVLPFLISGGLHAIRDVPVALGLRVVAGQAPPFRGAMHGRLIVCESPIGQRSEIAALVAELAEEELVTPSRRGWALEPIL